MKKFSILISFFLLFLLISGYFIQRDYKKTSETIYVNGNIVTLDSTNTIVNSMHVRDGRIIAIGNDTYRPKHASIVDLKGATVLPGFIDSHSHVALSSFLESMIDLSGFTHSSNAEIWNYLAKNIQTKKEGDGLFVKELILF